jgi:hypothetical protein
MRFCAESTAVTPVIGSGGQGATSLTTPIGHDRPPRPGAHPQPEAVHAGSPPVVRLEGPLALCHDSLLVAFGIPFRPIPHAGRTRSPSRSLARLCVSLVTGAGPGHIARIAAVSPTFGRLFEGTDDRCPGQTSARHTTIFNWSHTRHGASEQSYERAHQCCRTVGHSNRKLLASGMPFQTGTALDNEARMADRLPVQATYAGCLERRSRVPSAVKCVAMTAVLSTPVDNHVDSSSSRFMVYSNVKPGGSVVER